MKRCLWLLLPVWIATATVFAQSPAERPKPPGLPFESANAIVRYDCTLVVLQPEGKSEMLKHYRVALLQDRAIREYAQDITVYNLGYDTVEVIAARVHLPDGRTIEVGSDAVKDVPMPAFGKFFLQNVREKIITFPELQQGAEIEVVSRQITREPPMDGEFDLHEGFQHSDPIQQKYVEVLAPKSIELKWKSRSGEIAYSKTEAGDRVRHVWSDANIAQLVPEPGMPPAPEVYKQLLVTTVDDWTVWSRWYHDLTDPEMKANDEIRKMVSELTEGKATTEAKVREIFYFVSNNIRYVETALSGRKAGYKPEPAEVTFRNKYGVCRDKAALMVTMLREAGIKSDIVLMNPSWKIDGDIPVDQFNHAVVAVHDGDSTYFVDPTVEKTRDFLAANEQDKAVLICTAKGEPLKWTPIEPSERNLFQIGADSRLTEDGGFVSRLTISTRGLPDLILRNWLQRLSPEERQNTFKRMVQQISPSARLDSLIIGDPMNFNKTMEIKLAYSAKDYAIPAGKYVLFQVPNQAANLDFITAWLLDGSELTKRRYDLRLESTFAVRAEETVRYPKGFSIRSLPERVDQNYGDFRLARDFETAANTLKVKRVVDFSTLNISLERYGQLQELLKKSEAMGRGQVVLIKA